VPLKPCPICRHEAPRMLDAPSKVATVTYYRCNPCGHVWHIPKNDPDGPIVVVTDEPKPKG
jgi:uncharacterized Zn finger protein